MGGASMCGAYAQKAEAPKVQAPKTQSAKAPAAKAPSSKAKAPRPAPKPEITAERLDEVAAEQQISQSVVDIAGWVIASADNRGLPFAVVDKQAAQVLIFGADGKLRGMAPVLLGSAIGDDSAEGVGERELKDIPQADRTTPAGRYLAGYGPAAGGERVLWVDYSTSVSIHPMPTTAVARKEKRKERLASAKVDDNRITHGCINVSSAFYTKVVKQVFGKKGGVFYVLPEVEALLTAFPSFGLLPVQVADGEDGLG
jgi:hypothetical protein